MQEDVRRILKVAAPFAGVALGWYLFLPNFRVLALTGQYRSQLLINIQQLTEAGSNLRYELTTPEAEKEWIKCWRESLNEWGSWTSADPEYGTVTHRELTEAKCGPDPRKD